ncbi:MAG TPA: transmembrane 220 family protein [Candidatus Binatus sp.]|nr:transmembrane 220 family protein [Candidatus Binatus sp.]
MWLRLIAAGMGVLFLGFTSVQFNDPDWALWVGVYGVSALLSFAASAGHGWTSMSALLCLGTLAWSATLLPQLRHVTVAEIFGPAAMESQTIEEAREGLGLLIVSLWSAVLWIAPTR